MIFEDNVIKSELEKYNLSCKCGSIRYAIEIYKDDYGDYTWIMVKCKKCGELLYYNGA